MPIKRNSSSPVLALTDEKLSYLNELENQLLLVENRRSTWMLKTGDGSAAIDIFNLNFTSSDKRLPRKRKKTKKRRLERDEKLLKEWERKLSPIQSMRYASALRLAF